MTLTFGTLISKYYFSFAGGGGGDCFFFRVIAPFFLPVVENWHYKQRCFSWVAKPFQLCYISGSKAFVV